ncbi:EamA family transporter RarD [Sandarakinorhabdus sp. AAP62]|uniref:EamA family transporter RarD n=1 Tax=Sandarakinorhabdus sp. AAP62 TaxID=1248916 RepID=UPI00030527E4|nr:EamA family transporter RarD [Sandarakinorhabdus sp. AAP62]
MSATPSSEARLGFFAGMGAYLIWGVLPFYLRLLQGVPAADVLAHRILWTVLVVVLLISGLKGWGHVRAALRQPRLLLMLLASAVCITINWGVYTWAILAGHAIDTSLGYFINPLVSVLFGVLLLGERLGRLQWVAVGLAALGVAVLTIERGSLPLVSLALALSFGVYGLIRKQAAVDTATGLFVETLLLAPLATLWIVQTPNGFAGWPLMTTATLALGGLATAVPLLLFGFAARRLPLSTLGLMQYVAPTMVLLEAVLLFGEVLDPARLAAFCCIWAGLAVYTFSLRRPVAQPAQPR